MSALLRAWQMVLMNGIESESDRGMTGARQSRQAQDVDLVRSSASVSKSR
jgi:hypothetical protein